MKFFTRNELVGIIIILLAILGVSYFNFGISLRRGRDAQRKDDLGAVSGVLARYYEDFGVFPLSSSDGKIMACVGPNEKPTKDSKGNVLVNWIPCEWGKDGLRDVTDPSYPPYLAVLPVDPQSAEGGHYVYFSNGRRFQIYASLEGTDEDGYSVGIIERGISCGPRLCNYGVASGQTPLDISIEQYENELLRK